MLTTAITIAPALACGQYFGHNTLQTLIFGQPSSISLFSLGAMSLALLCGVWLVRGVFAAARAYGARRRLMAARR